MFAAAQRAAEAKKQHDALRAGFLQAAAFAWDASPISVARLVAELDEVLAHENPIVVTQSSKFISDWPRKLWNITRWNHFQASSGAAGMGFAAAAGVGMALASKGQGVIPVALQTDGDFMYISNALWTAAHHRIPLLTVMHNNRAYHAEHMNIQIMANRRQREVTQCDLARQTAKPAPNYIRRFLR